MAPTIDCGRKSRRRSRSVRKCGKRGKKRCSGKYGQNVNPFFNFLLCIKQRYKGISPIEVAKKGAVLWKKMSCKEKQEFIRAACKAQRRCRGRGKGRISRRSRRGRIGRRSRRGRTCGRRSRRRGRRGRSYKRGGRRGRSSSRNKYQCS